MSCEYFLAVNRIDDLRHLCRIISSTPGVTAYLFGSWSRKIDPKDFDLLLVYDPDLCSEAMMISLRQTVRVTAPGIFGLRAHITALTLDEEREVGFIEAEKCIELDCKFLLSTLPQSDR